MSKKLLLLLFMLLSSCSFFKSTSKTKPAVNENNKYLYTDKNGSFTIKVSTGINAKDGTYFLKKSIEIPDKDKDNVLEQSIAFSDYGKVKRTNILRPKLSQYTVWFDGKKYTSELKVIPKKKMIEVKMQSPEENMNGIKQIKFPSTKIISCFFSQLIDCVKATGFLEKSINKKKSKIGLFVIWEGYPFLNETYSDFPSELFSKAEFEFDGKIKENEFRFNLAVAGQSIFYILNKNFQFKKMFWVSQGITMIEKSEVQNSKESDDSE